KPTGLTQSAGLPKENDPMDKMTLRRIGWVGASLGLTTALVGCADVQSDADTTITGGGDSTTVGYLSADNGLSAINGLGAANGLNSRKGLRGRKRLPSEQ